MRPFVKWAGGKTRLLKNIIGQLPDNYISDNISTYFEPFVGGGAVLLYMLSNYNIKNAIINDENSDLMYTWNNIKNKHYDICSYLDDITHSYIQKKDEESRKKYYYEQRKEYNKNTYRSECYHSALFIFLNKTCYNGLYRVNTKGEFNVPVGRQKNINVDNWIDNICEINTAIQNVEIFNYDYKKFIESHINDANKSLFYFDPPYTIKHNNNGFIQYNEKLFSWNNQKELALIASKLKLNNNIIIVSNAGHDDIKKEYEKYSFTITPVSRASTIGSIANSRGQYSELIITSFNPKNMECS